MRDLVNGQERGDNDALSGIDMRGAKRFTLMLRSAKFISDGMEFLCIIRDVSETGIRLRLFHPVPRGERLTIETASGEHFAMELVWEANGEAGFRFIDPINVDAFVSESGPYPKRSIRLKVKQPATVRIGNDTLSATILDISRQGAKISIAHRLAIGQRFLLEARELPLFEATVCWRREPEYGVVFSQVMGLDDLARRSERMTRAAAGPISIQ